MSILVPTVGGAASGPSAGRFVPDEIIVKFRTSSPGAANRVEELRTFGARFRVREVRPLVKDFDRWPQVSRPLGDPAASPLTRRQEHLLSRRQRAASADPRMDLGNIYRIRLDLPAGESLEQVLAAYRSRPDVEYAELNPIISICAIPSDPLYAEQWALNKIRMTQAWDICRGSREIVIAVIDTGVDYNHPDLQGNLWINEVERDGLAGTDDDGNGHVDDVRGYNFVSGSPDPRDDHGHGTAVAGILAAVGNNGLDIAGVCWTARIMPLKILGAAGDGTAIDAVPAIYYAVANGAHIISASWGGMETSMVLRDAIAYAHEEGVIVVAAAGNNGSGAAYYPAIYPEVIAVAATDSSDLRWYLSNYGDWVNLAAPGRDILTLRATLPAQAARTTSTTRLSGTSMAAPHVSGACALLLAANPFLRCGQLQQILAATADPIQPGICSSNGRLNVNQALRAVLPLEGMVRMDRAYYPENAEIDLLVADWHLRGAGQGTVLLETSGGDQEIVTLQESTAVLGILRGTIPSRSGAPAPGDGILQVHDGGGIQARYLDADDGSGQAGQWRHASAVADYTPPAVLDVEAKSQNAAATIELWTSEPTRAQIRYGKTAGGPYDLVQRSFGLSEQHSVELYGLTPQTRYYFVVALTDEAGNQALVDDDGQGYSFVAER